MALTLKRMVRSTLSAISRWRVPCVEPIVVREFRHDPSAFTQGLAYADGSLYESCGGARHSNLRRIDDSDGRVCASIEIPNDFAEGIAIDGSLIYQLSWKSEVARVYRLADFALVKRIHYHGEGWGLCKAPSGFAMSNGSGTLQIVDASFHPRDRIRVTLNRLPTRRLNDLEWVGDFIYANVFYSDLILEISAHSGRVTRIVDCSGLREAIRPQDVEHTLNGIAYNPDRGAFYLTGKCWHLMFEALIPPAVAGAGDALS